MDPQPSAPPVVAVVVADQPGGWFEETLAALGEQDYPNQSVLVMDAGGDADSARRVASVLPDAYLRRVPDGACFAATANDVLDTVQGASFLVFCHDDVAMAPDAIRQLVEEALRSNAGIVAPKVVEWEHPDRLLDVGLAVDKTGACASLVERGELDQEQHDAVKDVFAVSNTCMLVRCDLFSVLGGFDPAMDHGADVDLCWRAQVAGARVVVNPAAMVRHLTVEERLEDEPEKESVQSRFHLRSMLKSYSVLHLVRVVPQALVVTLVEAVIALFARRWSEARALAGAWVWNLRQFPRLRPLRKAVKSTRIVADSEVRRLQVRGSVRLTAYLQRRLHAEERAKALVSAGHELVETVWKGPARAASVLLGLLALAILVGSRQLIGGDLPAIGQLAPFPSPLTFLTHYVDGWRTTGLGSGTAAPPVFALLGTAGLALLGGVGVLQKILVLGAWPLAAVGAWRFGRSLGSSLARLVVVIAYLAVPLPYDALSQGRWGALLVYGATPWLLTSLVRITHLAPFGHDSPRPLWHHIVALGAAVAVLSAFVPGAALAVVIVAVGLLLGSVIAGRGIPEGAEAVVLAFGALAVAAALLLPWTLDLIVPGGWSTVVGVARLPSDQPTFGALLRFQVGPLGAPPIGWALLAVAALPLILGQDWRLGWAVRLWIMALTCVGVAWAAGQGWLPFTLQSPDVLLAPAAMGLAVSAALGAAAFENDLRGYKFGWRQAASLAVGAMLVAVTLPVLSAVPDGRWHLPTTGVADAVAWMEPEAANGAFRVLWLGDPNTLPLDSWPYQDGLAYATSRDGPSDATDLLPGPPSDATGSISDALRVAQSGGTARLGRLLAPMGIRYLVVPGPKAPGSSGRRPATLPADLDRGLGSQLDLRLLPADASLAVYENTAWGPAREVAPAALVQGRIPASLGPGADLTGATAVLPGDGPVRFNGPIPGPGTVLVAESPSSRWELSVGDSGTDRSDAFGVANAYTVDQAGEGHLRYRTPLLRYGLVLANLALWVFVIRYLLVSRRRRTRAARQPA
jgi:GT2 family glycosyltransferase